MAKRVMQDVEMEIEPQDGDGIVPAETVLSADPEFVIVRARVHTWGLDPGDVIEVERTHLIQGLITIGHFEEVRPVG